MISGGNKPVKRCHSTFLIITFIPIFDPARPAGYPGRPEGRRGPVGRHAAGVELQDPDIGDRLEGV